MRRDLDSIEIKEPPIQELQKKNSCVKRSCFAGCGCAVLFILLLIAAMKFWSGPRSREVSEPPSSIPTDIELYDRDNINRVTILAADPEKQFVERAALLPKIVFAPAIIAWQKMSDTSSTTDKLTFGEVRDSFISLLERPVTSNKEEIEIEWTALPAQPKFIQNYYQTSLAKAGYTITVAAETNTFRQLIFEKDGLEGALRIEDRPEENGTDRIVVTLHIPLQ